MDSRIICMVMRCSTNIQNPFLSNDRLDHVELSKPIDVIDFVVEIKRSAHYGTQVDKIIFEIMSDDRSSLLKRIDNFSTVLNRTRHLIEYLHENRKLITCDNTISEYWTISNGKYNNISSESIIVVF